MLCVRDVMHTDFCRVERGESVADVARMLLFHNAESALVVDGEELLGIVTERDLLGIVTERDLLKAVLPTAAEINEKDSLRAFSDLVAVARDHFAAPVESVMTRPVRTIEEGASLIRAFGDHDLGAVPPDACRRVRRSGGRHGHPTRSPAGCLSGVATRHRGASLAKLGAVRLPLSGVGVSACPERARSRSSSRSSTDSRPTDSRIGADRPPAASSATEACVIRAGAR